MTASETRWWNRWRECDGATVFHVDLTPNAKREAFALSLLDCSETTRWRSILAMRARREFALCRAALRVTLADRFCCSPRELSFKYLKHGKPVAALAEKRLDVGFNVSHSGRHGLIAIADHDWLGIDVEERRHGRDMDGIGSMVFCAAERRLLETAAGEEKAHLFFSAVELEGGADKGNRRRLFT